MFAGRMSKAREDDEICKAWGCVKRRLVIVGGIGVTAFLPAIKEWKRQGLSYEVHYAVRTLEDIPFGDAPPSSRTAIYVKTKGERL